MLPPVRVGVREGTAGNWAGIVLVGALVVAALLASACAGSAPTRGEAAQQTTATAEPANSTRGPARSTTGPNPAQLTTDGPPVSSTTGQVPSSIDADVAALPEGHGATIAIVVDDAGGPEGFLAYYLALPIPLTISVIPSSDHATDVAQRTHTAGKEVLLHLPLANHAGDGDGVVRLNGTESAAIVDAFVQAAVDRVPFAVGANNHEGGYGSAQPTLMRALLGSLQRRGLFFMDSITSQRSVGFAIEAEVGLAPRVNNQFLDHLENDDDSRSAILDLARLASKGGSAVGICHVHHPYVIHVLTVIAPQLQARGYTFAPLSQVTDHLQGGLDTGVRTTVPG